MNRAAILMLALALGGCAADQPMGTMGHREAGTLIGAVGGAVIADATRPRKRCWYNSAGYRVCRNYY